MLVLDAVATEFAAAEPEPTVAEPSRGARPAEAGAKARTEAPAEARAQPTAAPEPQPLRTDSEFELNLRDDPPT